MKYLFLDTQVFDTNAYDFQNKHFRQIRALAESDDVCLLMPEITRREIERHIATKAKDAHAALEKFRRSGFQKNLRVPPFDAIAKGTTEETIRTELMEHFDEFCKAAKVMHLPAEGLDLAAVLDDYFGQKPPFGEGKKKSEFPDAFTAKILTAWCEKHSRQAIVVSGDGDWAGVTHPALEVLDNIARFLDRFPDPIVANQIRTALRASAGFAKALKKAFEDLTFYDQDYDAEITDLETDEALIEDIYVIQIREGVATVDVDVHFSFSPTGSGHRRHRGFRYDEDDEDDWVSGKAHGSEPGTVSVEVYFEDDPSDIDFYIIGITGISPYLDVSDVFE
jgi:hypothetical protein